MSSPPAATTHHDQQDVVNHLLAAAIQARATLQDVLRTAALSAADQPQAAADLMDTATTLTRIHDRLMRAADNITRHQAQITPGRGSLPGR